MSGPVTNAWDHATRRRRLAVLRTGRGAVGAAGLTIIIGAGLLGPYFAPYALDRPIQPPATPPNSAALLGTDFLGRDVLSRLLDGGRSLLWLAFLSVLGTYLVGLAIGLIAGWVGSWVDSVLMRSVDVFVAFPPLLLLLVLIASAGTGTWSLVVGIVLVLSPGVARIVRSATLEVSTRNYLDAAVARGERTPAILVREILPNVLPSVIADAGIRALYAIFLVASLNFLGLGSQPPAANWGLMIAENRSIISQNLWAAAAPALVLAVLAVSINLLGDAYLSTRGRREESE